MLSREQKRSILKVIIPPLMFVVLWLLYLSTRHRFHINEYAKAHNFIGAFWHGEFLMLPFLYRHFRKQVSKKRDKGFYIISSEHFDAEVMVSIYTLFGLKTLRGSSKKNGLKVLVESFKMLKNGYDIGISPDGPKGPYHSIADGIVAMSQKTGVPIIPIRVVFSRYWELKSWDKFRIPKPFAKIDYYMLEGFYLTPDLELESAKAIVLKHLEQEVESGF